MVGIEVDPVCAPDTVGCALVPLDVEAVDGDAFAVLVSVVFLDWGQCYR